MAEGWTKDWERRIVNGMYPLRRFLGQSDHSVVFLTDYKGQNIVRAAIKIVPADPALSDAQLAHWRTAATLSHPHLMRLLDSGRCQLGGHDFLFVVTDYAEQNLSQILPSRALSPPEVRALLSATLDALAYLHDHHLVQGGLKPSNFLVVHDELKLASDTIRPIGARPGIFVSSSYDPPEAKNGMMTTAGDLWGLGITLAESLTQSAPAWSRDSSETPSLPANLAPEFVDTVRRCLTRDPDRRPTVAELVAQLQAPPPVMSPAEVAPVVSPVAANGTSLQTLLARISPKERVFALWGALGIIALWAVWAGAHFIHSRTRADSVGPGMPASTSVASPSVASPPAAVERPKANAAPLPSVAHQEIPDVPRSVRESVRGVIKIGVRVSVDRSGNVVAATLEHRASSKYFGRAAIDAAAKWKFAPAPDAGTRVWRLQFEFARTGETAHATAVR